MTNVRSLAGLASVYPLTFENTELQVLDLDGHIWLTAADLSRGLGYARTDQVSRIYDRNRDEFTDGMTALIELQANEHALTAKLTASASAAGQARIFSARGCHLVAMLARTEKAKAFRKWVLDVLDSLERMPAPKSGGLSDIGKANMLEQVLDKATEMLVTSDGNMGIDRINKLAEEKAAELLREERRRLFPRVLLETTDDGELQTRVLRMSERIISDDMLADYIADWQNGPATYWLPRIIAAANQRMIDMCNLPFAERCNE